MSLQLVKEVMVSMLNDEFRQSGFGVTMTNGAMGLPDVCGLMRAVRLYNQFDIDNDPYEEHDFGSLEWHNDKVFWKIDYYDKTLQRWEDPLSSMCNRVLTVMLASEY